MKSERKSCKSTKRFSDDLMGGSSSWRLTSYMNEFPTLHFKGNDPQCGWECLLEREMFCIASKEIQQGRPTHSLVFFNSGPISKSVLSTNPSPFTSNILNITNSFSNEALDAVFTIGSRWGVETRVENDKESKELRRLEFLRPEHPCQNQGESLGKRVHLELRQYHYLVKRRFPIFWKKTWDEFGQFGLLVLWENGVWVRHRPSWDASLPSVPADWVGLYQCFHKGVFGLRTWSIFLVDFLHKPQTLKIEEVSLCFDWLSVYLGSRCFGLPWVSTETPPFRNDLHSVPTSTEFPRPRKGNPTETRFGEPLEGSRKKPIALGHPNQKQK